MSASSEQLVVSPHPNRACVRAQYLCYDDAEAELLNAIETIILSQSAFTSGAGLHASAAVSSQQ